MSKRVCHLVDKTVDPQVVNFLGRGWTSQKVASLRGLYDEYREEEEERGNILPELDYTNPESIANTIRSFRSSLRSAHYARLNSGIKHIERCWDALRYAYSLHERNEAISCIANLFSQEVDRFTSNGGVDRQSFINGFITKAGEKVGGQFSILEGVYNYILTERQGWYTQAQEGNYQKAFDKWKEGIENGTFVKYAGMPLSEKEYQRMAQGRYEAYTKLLENWNELIPFALKQLVSTEGVKIGLNKEFSAAASSDTFGDNDIAAKWDISESKRDGWQNNSDLISAFGSVGKQVRRILSTVPQMIMSPDYKPDVNGNPIFVGNSPKVVADSFGNLQYMDPVRTHQALEEVLYGSVSSDDMMSRLCSDEKHTKAKVAWMQGIVDILNASPQAKTQFFVNFKKSFQSYSEMQEKRGDYGLKKIKTILLNKAKNLLGGKYNIAMSSRGRHTEGSKVWKPLYVFGEGHGGKGALVNWENLAAIRKEVLLWTEEQKPEAAGVFDDLKAYNTQPSMLTELGKNKRKSQSEKKEFLMKTFSALGFDVDIDTVESILNSRDIYRVRELLQNLFNSDGAYTGLTWVLYGKQKSAFNTLSFSTDKEERDRALKTLGEVEYRTLYNSSPSGEDKTPIKQHTEKLLSIISKHQEGHKVESRIRYQDNTMFSHVAPSYLSDKLDVIKGFVETDNKEGLLNYLNEEYLQSPFFASDLYISTNGQQGEIYNMWLDEMVKACQNPKVPLMNSVVDIFTYERDLGSDVKKFEDFSSKEHALDMLVHFWADEQQFKSFGGRGINDPNRRLSALYPVFILGDAGVSKYIRAPRITSTVAYNNKGVRVDPTIDTDKIAFTKFEFDEEAENKVINAFWNIYLQEKRRMKIDEAIAHTMYANGKPVQKAVSSFSILTFLNSDSQEYNHKYAISDNDAYNESKVKRVIREYLNDATLNGITAEDGRQIPSFKKRLEELGVLETKEISLPAEKGKKAEIKQAYLNISSIANPQNIDNKLKEFFWNTKLATAQQLQIMTIDPSFYHGTKDLQKRYKEIHAPGNILDVTAIDFDGERYSADGVERVIYFEDLSINAEDFNPEFMETILRVFAVADKETVDKAVKNGILKPLKGNAESKRQDDLRKLLGDEGYNLYSSYTANTLTDGQGFRTLKSYRKVMGMAGRWTKQMDDAYKRIMAIRELHAADNSSLTSDELREISQLGVVLQPIKPYMFTHEKYPIRIAKTDDLGNEVKDASGNTVMIDAYQYIPVQHKYAEALIIPELLPEGNKLRDLALWMDSKDIDMAGSTKIVKVGCFGQANFKYKTTNLGQLLDKDGNVIMKDGKPLTTRTKGWQDEVDDEGNTLAVPQSQNKAGLEDALSRATVHQLPYQDYRIQTNVPEHINASQLFGTQVRKLIMAGILMEGDKSDYLPTDFINLDTGEGLNQKAPLTASNILALFNSLICSNIWDSYDKFSSNASDIEKLSDLLKQSTIGSTREAMDNIFSYVVTGMEKGNKKFFMPLFEGGLEHDTAALILSTFKKIVNKQQISGGSAVQVSAFGIKGYEEDGDLRFIQDPNNKSNILYAECEMPFDRHFTIDTKAKNGTTVKLNVDLSFDTYCFTDAEHYGELIPSGKPLTKDNPEYKKYLPYTYKEVDGKLVPCKASDPQAKVYKPLIEQEYPDILSILAYRIPTERDYSMLNLKIKRFTSKVAGGTIKVPPQGTTIAGFDFDIDKLYFMQREYHKHINNDAYNEKNYSDASKIYIWNDFYTNNGEIQKALEEARSVAEARDPSLVSERTLPSGRVRTIHHTTLNSYWEQAQIEEKYGKDKNNAFLETALNLGEKPDLNTNVGAQEYLETYDFNKTPEENTRAARNNLLISLIQARLSDPATVKQRYTPGGFKNASAAARFIREILYGDLGGVVNGKYVDLDAISARHGSDTDPEPNYDPTNPYTILVYNQQNQVAGKLIGIFANQNTHHAFCSAMETFELNDSISFCGKRYSDLLHKKDGMAAQADLAMAEFLAASVDAVKDPTLNFLNLNTLTADAGALLVRLGYTTKEIGLLFNQPIVLKVCQDAFNSNSSATSALYNAIDAARTELGQHISDARKGQEVDLSANNLALSIIQNRRNLEEGGNNTDFMHKDAVMQAAVLDLFNRIVQTATDVSAFVLSTKFTASNAVKSTLGGLYAQQNKTADYLSGCIKTNEGISTKYCKIVVSSQQKLQNMFALPIDNKEEYLDYSKQQYLHEVRYNPFAYEQLMFDCNRKILRTLGKFYPYDKPMYSSARSMLQELSLYGTLTEDEINDIHAELPVAALARQKASLFDGEAPYVRNGKVTNATNREYYREHFAKELTALLQKYPELDRYSIFDYVHPDLIQKNGIDSMGLPTVAEVNKLSVQDVGGLDSETKESIRESWAALMEVDEYGLPKNQDFFNIGRDLFMYCYYQMGFTFSPISFMHLAPTQVKDFIKVPRSYDLEIGTFDTTHPDGDDVFVFSKGDEEKEVEADSYGAAYNDPRMISTLHNESFCWPEKLTPNDVRTLITEALSHPELKFKINRELTEKELELFDKNVSGYNVPSNILFSKETKERMSLEVQQSMGYGRSRSYRQFLYEILDGKNMGMETNDFVQQFILNHLDNTKWVLNVDWIPNVKSAVYKQLVEENSLVDKSGHYRNAITIDVSSLISKTDREVADRLVRFRTDKEGNIIDATWTPVLKIGESYYMADNTSLGTLVSDDFPRFNMNASSRMTYRKVVPLGTSKEMSYDNNQKIPASMKYMSSMNAQESRGDTDINSVVETVDNNTEASPYSVNDAETDNSDKAEGTKQNDSQVEQFKKGNGSPNLMRQALEQQIIAEYRAVYEAKGEEIDFEGLAEQLHNISNQDLMDTVQSLINAVRVNGVVVLDEDGNPVQSC